MRRVSLLAALVLAATAHAVAQSSSRNLPQFDGARALEITRHYVAVGPRWIGSPGHAKAEAFIKDQFRHDHLEEDTFTTATPAGPMTMHNFIVRFPGKKDGVIVLATHYETNYPLRNIHYVGANDGGSTAGLLIEMASYLRGRTLDGYSVWLLFTDGEEAVQNWTAADSVYGSRHLAEKWQADGTLKRIKAFILADMLGDRDLDVQRDLNSTPWLEDLVLEAAAQYGWQSYFFQRKTYDEDDHIPFVHRGVPCADLIDLDYGYQNAFWHTADDTMDKLSAKSLTIAGDTILETVHLLDQR